mmetsp:Transcript_77536/g.219228  ORF Transcript_77536/g.219228 Transcript_77536/m.219228 type:complete len:255 (-) Transcript_77536:689-1453(-)
MVEPGLPPRARHLLVEAPHRRARGRLLEGPPITHDEAAETHLALQVAGQEFLVRAGVGPVHHVVAAHDRPGAGLHPGLEGRVVDLPGGALIHDRVLPVAVRLLVVEAIVLQASHHALALHAADVVEGQLRPEIRVFARHVLEVPAVPGGPVHLHTGPEDDVCALTAILPADGLGSALDEIDVPGRAHGERRWPHYGGACNAQWPRHVPEAVAGVVELQRGHPKMRDRRRVAHVVPSLRYRREGERVRDRERVPA